MGGEVVEDDTGSGLQFRHQHLLDIGGESVAVHCAFDHPGCDQPVLGKPCNQRLRAPFAEGGGTGQARAAHRASSQTGQVGLHRPSAGVSIPRIAPLSRFDVDENQPFGHATHKRHAVRDPVVARLSYARGAAFIRDEALFLNV